MKLAAPKCPDILHDATSRIPLLRAPRPAIGGNKSAPFRYIASAAMAASNAISADSAASVRSPLLSPAF
jgi:hypothetical protein